LKGKEQVIFVETWSHVSVKKTDGLRIGGLKSKIVELPWSEMIDFD